MGMFNEQAALLLQMVFSLETQLQTTNHTCMHLLLTSDLWYENITVTVRPASAT